MAILVQRVIDTIRRYTITIPAADFRTASSSPFKLINAIAGINSVVQPIVDTITLRKEVSGVAYDFPSGSIRLIYANVQGDVAVESAFHNTSISDTSFFNTTDKVVQFGSVQNAFSVVKLNSPYPTNKSLWFYIDGGDATAGDGEITLTFDAIEKQA